MREGLVYIWNVCMCVRVVGHSECKRAVPLAMAQAPLPTLLAEDLVFTEEETESEGSSGHGARRLAGRRREIKLKTWGQRLLSCLLPWCWLLPLCLRPVPSSLDRGTD